MDDNNRDATKRSSSEEERSRDGRPESQITLSGETPSTIRAYDHSTMEEEDDDKDASLELSVSPEREDSRESTYTPLQSANPGFRIVSANFEQLVLGCIEADFYNQGLILQH